MNDHYYQPGSWFAVVSPRAVILLEDSVSPSRLQAIWDTCNVGPSLDELIEVVTGGRFTGAPFFGIAVKDGGPGRLLIRTGVTAVVGESNGSPRVVVSHDPQSWVEEIVPWSQPIRLLREVAVAPTLTLPVSGGIGLADEGNWTPPGAVAAAPASPP